MGTIKFIIAKNAGDSKREVAGCKTIKNSTRITNKKEGFCEKLNAVFLITSLIFAMTGCRENEAAVISKRTEDAAVSSDPITSEK